MTDAQLAAAWRQAFECLDDLLYGFLLNESERREARWHRSLRGKSHRWTTPVRRAWLPIVWRFWRTFPALAERLTEREARRQPNPDPTVVTFADLSSARHGLSVPRFYPQQLLAEEHFRYSDPLSGSYAGKLEAEFRRVRNEIDSEPA